MAGRQLSVAYRAGSLCNGTGKSALHLATLGLPVKVIIGGMTGWSDEGAAVEHRDASSRA